MNPENILHDVVSWGEKYPYAFPRWFGPFLPTLVVHHPEYAKTILGRSGSLYLWFWEVFDTFLPKKYWETCLELSPLPASFTTIAILFFCSSSQNPRRPQVSWNCLYSWAKQRPGACSFQFPVSSQFEGHLSYCLLSSMDPTTTIFPSKPNKKCELSWQWLSEGIWSLLLCSLSVEHMSGMYTALPSNSHPLFPVVEFAMAVSFTHTYFCSDFLWFFQVHCGVNCTWSLLNSTSGGTVF